MSDDLSPAERWQETSPYANLPCREFCNHKRRGCEPGRCCSPYERDDPRYWIGRGNEPVAGKSIGWSHNMEREGLRRHLRRRLWKFGLDRFASFRLEQRAQKIAWRLDREYQKRKAPMGVRRRAPRPVEPPRFTADELRHLVELFEGANDPTSASIAAKAAALLERTQA